MVGSPPLARVWPGSNHACAITSGGDAFCWGGNQDGELGAGANPQQFGPNAVSGGIKFSAIAAGASHTCGLTTNDAVYCWGSNRFGELGHVVERVLSPAPVIGLTGVVTLTAGATSSHTCALNGAGTAFCWGNNANGELDRKSTRLNSSHLGISYAVFCL